MLQYDFLASLNIALHATDLLPTFWNIEMDTAKMFEDLLGLNRFLAKAIALVFDVSGYAPGYQSYFVSHAVSGDPNSARRWNTVPWYPASDNGQDVTNVMETQFSAFFNFFNGRTVDHINTHAACDFWIDVAFRITNLTVAGGEISGLDELSLNGTGMEENMGTGSQVPLEQ